jgi:hypothetical protein
VESQTFRRAEREPVHEKWPGLAEQRTPPGAIASVLDAWVASGQPDETNAQFHPKLMAIAAKWSVQPRYRAFLSTARDLDAAISVVTSDEVPTAADVGFAQMRDRKGQMRHLVAVVLMTP